MDYTNINLGFENVKKQKQQISWREKLQLLKNFQKIISFEA